MKKIIRKSLFVLMLSTGVMVSCTNTNEDKNNTSSTSLSESEILLRYHPKQGDEYVTKFDMDMKMDGEQSMNMEMDMDMVFKIGEVNKDNSYYSSMVINRVVTDMNMNSMKIKYDSDLETQEGMGEMMGKIYSKMINVDIKSKLSNRGEILEAPNFAEMFAGNEAVKKQMEESSDMTNNSTIQYPEEPVKVGSTWDVEIEKAGATAMNVKSTYTVKEITDTEVVLTIVGNVLADSNNTMSMKMLGESVLDRESGFMKKMNLGTDMKMEVMGKKMDMKMDMKMTMIKK